jgi:hypothetical protein
MGDKSKNFFQGIIDGIEDAEADSEEDSLQLSAAKTYITEEMNLSFEDKIKLGGWLMGDAMASSLTSALESLFDDN